MTAWELSAICREVGAQRRHWLVLLPTVLWEELRMRYGSRSRSEFDVRTLGWEGVTFAHERHLPDGRILVVDHRWEVQRILVLEREED